MGMAVKSELSDEGFALWTEWSQSDENYNERDAQAVWKSISASGGVTIRTLFKEASKHGWRPKKEPSAGAPTTSSSANSTRPSAAADDNERRRIAAARASDIWNAALAVDPEHPYLTRKGVKPYGLRLYRGDLAIGGIPCDGALIIPVRDAVGHLHSLEFITSSGEKRYLPDGRISAGYHAIGKPNGTLVIAEGYATAASIYEATGHATACGFNAGNLVPVAKALRAKFPDVRIIIGADNDAGGRSNAGIEKANEAASAAHALVAVPDLDGAKADFNDIRAARGDDVVREAIEAAKAPSRGSVGFVGTGGGHFPQSWSDPKPLQNALPPVKEFIPELLPEALRDWVVDVAERTQAPLEYVAVSAMVSLGAALGRKVAVRPKRRDDWQEFANLWGAVIGPPSWMKSPALDEGKRPLSIIEGLQLESYELIHREWEADSEAAKVKRDGAKDRARTAARKGQSFDKSELVADLIPEEPRPARLIVNDATVPALCDVLRANPNGVLVFRDELAGLIAELDREGMEGARGFYLTGWSGKDGHTQDRIARGTNLRVPFVCLSMLGGIQPARVAPILRESIATGGGDGFLARFSLAVWPDSPGEYKAMDRQPDAEARQDAYAVFNALHALTPADIGAEIVDGSAPFLRLEPAATEAFTEWDVELRNRMRSGVDDGALSAHLLKYPKTISGLALLIHLADGGTGDVGLPAISRALAWSELLESHARRIYSSLGQAHIDAARSLLGRLKRGDLESPFTVRKIYVRGWAHLSDPESARSAVDVLESHGFVRGLSIDTGGRPSMAYHLNPAVRT